MNLKTYVDLDWSVFPVKGPAYGKDYSDTKRPMIESWKPYQTRKPTPPEISDWMKRYPKMSIGAPTGPVSGFLVVDIDSDEWIKTFPNADFGTTWKSISKRGCHYFYKWEDWMLSIPSTGSEIGGIRGFDIRGVGGYVVVPNESEPDRKWAFSPTDGPLELCPAWIKEFLLKKRSTNVQKKSVAVSDITEGNRHSSFLSLTGKLHRAKLSASEILAVLSPLAIKTGFTEEIEPLIKDVTARYPNAPDRRETIRPESLEALLSEPEPPLEWMIEGLWVDKSKGFIAGHPGIGKTWIALDMILAVATGGLALGKYKAAYKAPCLIVEEEASRRNLQRRIYALSRARNLEPSDLASVYHITQQFISIPRDAAEIAEFVRSKGIKFVVFDSLRAVHSSKENSSDEMALVLKAFSEISIMGNCSVLLIHHLSKSSADNASKSVFERMRGTGSMWAWRDCILGIEGEEESEVSKCTFQFRDAESPAPVQIKRHVGELTGAIGLQAATFEETEEFYVKSNEIRTFIKSQMGGASRNDICKAIEGRKQDKLTILKRMEKLKMIVKVGVNLVVPE